MPSFYSQLNKTTKIALKLALVFFVLQFILVGIWTQFKVLHFFAMLFDALCLVAIIYFFSSNIKKQKIKIKWKGGLIIFLLVIAISLLAIPGPIIWWGEGWTPILMPILMWVLPTVVFIISISFTLKKLKEGTYNTKWLLKFNLLGFLVMVILMDLIFWELICIEGLSRLSPETSGLGLGEASLGFFYIPEFVFLSLVLFSILPSLIYKKLINKKRVLSIIFWTGLVLSIILLFLGISCKNSCDCYSTPECVAEKAVKEENIDLCEKIKTPYNRNACYFGISYRGYKDMEICQRMQGQPSSGQPSSGQFLGCVINIAINSKNEKVCNQFKKGDKDYCMFQVAEGLKDKDICNQIKDAEEKEDCLSRVDYLLQLKQ